MQSLESLAEHLMLVSSGIDMREQAARVSVHRRSDLTRTLLRPDVGPTIHAGDGTRVETAREGQRPAYQLDVTAEGERVGAGQRIHERLEHHAHMIAGDERIYLGA